MRNLPWTRLACFIVVSAYLPIGCGKDSSSRDQSSPPIIPIVLSEFAPISYALEDPDCQKQSASQAITSTTVHSWSGAEVKPQSVALQDVTSYGSLKNPFVESVSYGDEYIRFCDWSKNPSYCIDAEGNEINWNKNETQGELRICRNDHAYGRESYEGVALASLYHLQKSQQAYAKHEGAAKIPPIKLTILPHFIDYYDNYPVNGEAKRLKRFITHNMAYFPGSSIIAVFPENVQHRRYMKGFFWESEFILGHEYAHHIDLKRNQPQLEALGLTWNPLSHTFDDHYITAKTSASSARAKVYGAIGEAFADLLSYYAQKSDASSLIGIPCFGINRDIGQAKFANSAAKTLTTNNLNIFFGLKADEEPLDCLAPQYADIHTAGAIIAHTMNGVFQRLIAATPNITPGSEAEHAARYKLTLMWNTAVYKTTENPPALTTTAGAELFAPLISSIESVTSQWLASFPLNPDRDSDGVKAELCTYVAKQLPALPTPFRPSSGERCPHN